MTMIKKAIVDITTANSAVNAIISGRIYSRTPPQGPTFPCLTYSRVTDPPDLDTHDGFESREGVFQLNCWAKDEVTLDTLVEAVRACWKNYKGTSSTVTIMRARVSQVVDLPFEPDLGVYQTAVELTIKYF